MIGPLKPDYFPVVVEAGTPGAHRARGEGEGRAGSSQRKPHPGRAPRLQQCPRTGCGCSAPANGEPVEVDSIVGKPGVAVDVATNDGEARRINTV